MAAVTLTNSTSLAAASILSKPMTLAEKVTLVEKAIDDASSTSSRSSTSPLRANHTDEPYHHHEPTESRRSSVATTATVMTATALDQQESVYVIASMTTKPYSGRINRTTSTRNATTCRRVRFHDRRRGTTGQRMVSSTSLAWTCLLVQLVLSCVCLIASLAIIAAKLQSTSIHPEKQHISIEWWSFCVMSFLMIWATIFSMLGLSGHKKMLILPHILLLLVYSLFVGRVLLLVLLEFELTELNWLIGVCVLTTAEIFLTCSIVFEFRTVVLAGEMVLLITGITAIGMLHGWTEGVGYHMREYYTPLWACAVLMCALLLLIISLAMVFIFLHFNCPGIIKQHIFALAVSWPLSLCITVSAVVAGAPILVGIVLILFFSSLLPFAYIYSHAEWTTATEDSPVI